MQSSINMRKDSKKSSLVPASPGFLKYSLGVDIGKDELSVCLCVIDLSQHIRILGSRTFKNTPDGFTQLYQWQQKKYKDRFIPLVYVMEATGNYYENLALYLNEKQMHISVLLPSRAKAYLKSLGHKSKTDKMDSKGLAYMGAQQNLEPWKAPCPFCIELRQLTRFCESTQQSYNSVSNQLEALKVSGYKNKQMEKRMNKYLALLKKDIGEIKKEVEELIKSDHQLYQKVQRIAQIKGLGIYTIAVVLSETGFFEMFHSQAQLVSYAGYDVVENSSGKRIGKTKISKKGNSHIRRAMHLPAFSVVRWKEPIFVSLYERIYERRKRKMVAYVAVQRKLLLMIYTLWKKEEVYQPQYGNTIPG